MIKVFGIGNPLLMDDAIGIEVTKNLKERFTEHINEHNTERNTEHINEHNTERNTEHKGIRKYITEIYVEDALEQIEEGDYIVIIDATHFEGRAGEVRILPFEDCRKYMRAGAFCHNRSLLYTLIEEFPQIRGELIGVEIYCVDYHEGLSMEMRERLPYIIEKVNERMKEMSEA